MLQKMLLLISTLAFSALNMSALVYVDLGFKAGVGLDFAHYANFGDSVHTFYDQTKLKGLAVTPSFGINTDLWFTEHFALSVNFNANFNRGGEVFYTAKEGENRIEFWTLDAMRTLWQIENGVQGSINYRYHSLALELMAKTAFKWWYIGAGAGVVVHIPSALSSNINTFRFNKMVWYNLQDENDHQLSLADVKATVGVNLVLETGFNLPIHKNGFINLGGRLRYDILARAKKYSRRDRPLQVAHYDDNELWISTVEAYIENDTKNLFNTNTIRFGSPFIIDFFVGYTYRFNM